MQILLVEDDMDFQRVLAEYLSLSGFEVTTANHGKHGLETFEAQHFDLCILDIMMPVMDGFTLAQKLRKVDSEIPIIFLTAKNQKEDKMQGLKIGADDYITKPFEAEELVLRMNNILRRSAKKEVKNTVIGNLELKMDELKLYTPSGKSQLTIREAELFNYLIEHKDEVVAREQILQELWGKNDYFMGRSMDVFISRIRKYLQEDPSLELETIRGVGFKLTATN